VSKSLKRVKAEATVLGLSIEIIEENVLTTTAQMAADARGCVVDQIVKSILFRVEDSAQHVLFLTAGNNRVDPAKAAQYANQPLTRADATSIRSYTGFAIGGVSPLGHLNPVPKFFDPRLLDFDLIWAAAGTPRHVFSIDPNLLLAKTGATLAPFTA